MFIESLHLKDFRNYEDTTYLFSRGTNLILGKNGAGKSNLIEALYMLSTSKSFRKTPDRKILRWETERYLLRGAFSTEHGTKEIELQFSGEGRLLSIDGAAEKRISSIIGHVLCVLYFFEDIYLVSGPPHLRRSYLDLVLSTVDPLYLDALQRYVNVLRQKGRYLFRESERVDRDLLSVWNEQLIQYGAPILHKRLRLVGFINSAIDTSIDTSDDSSPDVSPGCSKTLNFPYRLIYKSSVRAIGERATWGRPTAGCPDIGRPASVRAASGIPNVEDVEAAFRDELEMNGGRERAMKKAIIGPHRDDFSFTDGRLEVRYFASLGEARLASIVLKLAQAMYYRETRHVLPILLFDDIFLELDVKNMEKVIALIGEESQRIVTTTEREKLSAIFHCNRVFTIHERGNVTWEEHGDSTP